MTLIKLNKMKGLGEKRAQSPHKIFIKYYGTRPLRKGEKIYSGILIGHIMVKET